MRWSRKGIPTPLSTAWGPTPAAAPPWQRRRPCAPAAIREKARRIAAHLLEAAEEGIVWEERRFIVQGVPGKSVTFPQVAFAAYTNLPPAMEPGPEAVYYYGPPNLTFPFGTYACVKGLDR
ncbi:MAG: molybdopterin-dependent oxidoreductase [Thermoflexus sp.]|nr:molybdopterin-dependent oxidoreductase [Thermoflexus sp.]